MKRILITGSSGLLGRPLYQACRTMPDWRVMGTALTRLGEGRVKLDLLDAAEVSRQVAAFRPHVIIHTAAERHPDICEDNPGLTTSLNVDATRHLAEEAHKCGAWMIYVSTDYVFDGKHPPYAPESAPNPVNAYAVSKLAGERAVQDACRDACIIRVSALLGPSESLEEGPITSILTEVRRAQQEEVVLDDWARRYPTYTVEAAQIFLHLIHQKIAEPGLSGIFHWAGNEPVTRYEMGLKVGEMFDLSTARLRPRREPQAGAPRPKDVQLDCSRLEAYNFLQRTPLAEALRLSLQPFVSGSV